MDRGQKERDGGEGMNEWKRMGKSAWNKRER